MVSISKFISKIIFNINVIEKEIELSLEDDLNTTRSSNKNNLSMTSILIKALNVNTNSRMIFENSKSDTKFSVDEKKQKSNLATGADEQASADTSETTVGTGTFYNNIS